MPPLSKRLEELEFTPEETRLAVLIEKIIFKRNHGARQQTGLVGAKVKDILSDLGTMGMDISEEQLSMTLDKCKINKILCCEKGHECNESCMQVQGGDIVCCKKGAWISASLYGSG